MAILGVLRSAVGQVGAQPMDAVDPGLVAAAREALTTVEGIQDVDELRLRWIGHNLRAEVGITVVPTMTDGWG